MLDIDFLVCETDQAPFLMNIAVWSLVRHLGSVVAVTAIAIAGTVVGSWSGHCDGMRGISGTLLAIEYRFLGC
jgi:hypothetical protein